MSELFLALFNRAIAAGWLVLAIVALRPVLHRAARRFHCALWGLVGLRLVWPFSLKSPLSLLPSAETVPPEILYDPSPTIQTGVTAFNSAVNPILSQSMAPNPGDSVNPLQVYTAVAANLWLLVFVALLVYTAVSYLRIRRTVATAVLVEDGVYQSEHIASPFLLGIFRPRIYLPCSLTPQQQECVLAHERAHLRRRDHWWKPLGWLLVCVFWFHPLLWLAYALLGRDMELSCDEAVIRTMDLDGKKAYSYTLLSCSAPRRTMAACPLAFGEADVKRRIRAVLHYQKPAFWLTALAATAVVITAVCFLTDPLPPAVPTDPTLPAVSWRYSPIGSATWFHQFSFDFGELEYTHIEATCDTGDLIRFDDDAADHTVRSVTLKRGLALCWSPYNGSFTNTPNAATIEFTVYNGLLPLHSGTIHLTCTDRYDLAATYEARMDGDLRILRDAVLPGARVITKAQYDSALSPENIVRSGVDLDHDGRKENIYVSANSFGDRYTLLVVEDGSLLWSTCADYAHANWNTVLLCRHKGKDYLLEELNIDRENYVLPIALHSEEADYAAAAKALANGAEILLSTENNQVVIGPVPATEVYQLYPVSFYPAK